MATLAERATKAAEDACDEEFKQAAEQAYFKKSSKATTLDDAMKSYASALEDIAAMRQAQLDAIGKVFP